MSENDKYNGESKQKDIPNLKIEKNQLNEESSIDLDKAIRDLNGKLSNIQNEGIKNTPNEQIEEILAAVNDIIVGNDTMSEEKCNESQNKIELIYRNQKVSLEYETKIINQEMNEVKEHLKTIEKEQEMIEQKNNNLIYHILSFIASFSIVSAAVAAIDKMESILSIVLFMLFDILLLLTTLIGLHNFYISKDGMKMDLNNNYFLWIIVFFIMIFLFIILTAKYLLGS